MPTRHHIHDTAAAFFRSIQKYRAGIGAIEVGERIGEVFWHWHTGQVVIAIEVQRPVVNTAGRVRTESNVSISTLASGILRDLVLWHRDIVRFGSGVSDEADWM